MTIWTGKFVDEVGEFKILVPAANREDATRRIKGAIDYLLANLDSVQPSNVIIGTPALMYIEEVGTYDMVRLRK